MVFELYAPLDTDVPLAARKNSSVISDSWVVSVDGPYWPCWGEAASGGMTYLFINYSEKIIEYRLTMSRSWSDVLFKFPLMK